MLNVIINQFVVCYISYSRNYISYILMVYLVRYIYTPFKVNWKPCTRGSIYTLMSPITPCIMSVFRGLTSHDVVL